MDLDSVVKFECIFRPELESLPNELDKFTSLIDETSNELKTVDECLKNLAKV